MAVTALKRSMRPVSIMVSPEVQSKECVPTKRVGFWRCKKRRSPKTVPSMVKNSQRPPNQVGREFVSCLDLEC